MAVGELVPDELSPSVLPLLKYAADMPIDQRKRRFVALHELSPTCPASTFSQEVLT